MVAENKIDQITDRQQSKQASKQNPAAHCCRCHHPSCGCSGRPRASSRPGGTRRQTRQGAWGRKRSNSKAATRGAGAPPMEHAGRRSRARLDSMSEGAWNAVSAFPFCLSRQLVPGVPDSMTTTSRVLPEPPWGSFTGYHIRIQ